MAIMREETFGPTIPIMTYRTFDEAISFANDSPFGLGANLYTHDPVKAKRFFEEVEAGTLWINDPLTDNDAGPFGGFKDERHWQRTGRGRSLMNFARPSMCTGISRALQSRGGIHMQRNKTPLQSLQDRPEQPNGDAPHPKNHSTTWAVIVSSILPKVS